MKLGSASQLLNSFGKAATGDDLDGAWSHELDPLPKLVRLNVSVGNVIQLRRRIMLLAKVNFHYRLNYNRLTLSIIKLHNPNRYQNKETKR